MRAYVSDRFIWSLEALAFMLGVLLLAAVVQAPAYAETDSSAPPAVFWHGAGMQSLASDCGSGGSVIQTRSIILGTLRGTKNVPDTMALRLNDGSTVTMNHVKSTTSPVRYRTVLGTEQSVDLDNPELTAAYPAEARPGDEPKLRLSKRCMGGVYWDSTGHQSVDCPAGSQHYTAATLTGADTSQKLFSVKSFYVSFAEGQNIENQPTRVDAYRWESFYPLDWKPDAAQALGVIWQPTGGDGPRFVLMEDCDDTEGK